MLERLDSFHWFSSVGQLARSERRVRNWEEAVDSCGGAIWSSVQHQVKNRIAGDVTQRDYGRSEEWNGVAAELRKAIAVVVAKSVELVATRFKLKPDFQGAVSWDMLMICMETEYSDLVPPVFWVPRLLPVYAAGRFPCGWKGPELQEGWAGELPNWELVVY